MSVQLRIKSFEDPKTSIVLYSGGLGSFCAAYLEVTRIGLENCIFYFNDTLVEDADLYRFLVETVCWFHGKKINRNLAKLIKTIPDLEKEQDRKKHLLSLGYLLDSYCSQFHYDPDGKNIFDVFTDERYLGNTKIDPCSRVLKRERSHKFINKFSPSLIDVVVGMDWSEIHRIEAAIPYWLPYKLRSPMCPVDDEDTNWQPRDLTEEFLLTLSGIKKPIMYNEGFPHNNCSGFCVKAGLSQFKLLFIKRPDVYAYFERKQEELHELIPTTRPFLRKSGKIAESLIKDHPEVRYSISKDGVTTAYLTLKQYRKYLIEPNLTLSEEYKYDFGGCGCAI